MKIHVWGGPMDGRIVNLPKPRSIMMLQERPVMMLWSDSPVGYDLVPRLTYEPMQFTAPIARHRDWPEAWFVLVPAGAGEDELAALLAANTTPMVDGGARGEDR